MPKTKLKILLKPSYRATAAKLGLDPDGVYENDRILFQQGYDMTEIEVNPGRIFSISERFEHGEISFDDVKYILLDEEQDEFEDEFDEMDNDGLILKPGNYIYHSDGITIEQTVTGVHEDEDGYEDDDLEDDEDFDQDEQLILNTITNSAKRRFNYAGFESGFSSFDSTIAHNILLETITLLASGETPALASAKLFNKILMMGLTCDKTELDDFVKTKTEELKIEIYVITLARQMLQDGTNPLAVLEFVRKMLN
ncbi:MAG TPA: hypothetical protein VK668_21170 [Mucilaginibacter sp.]|nr:hypothetical protein [Mucilaginibacter sp.]